MPQSDHLLRGKACLAAAFLILVIHAVVASCGGVTNAPGIYVHGGLSRAGISDGGYWQILTYAWLHGNVWHVGFNAACLLAFGLRSESMVGAREMGKVMGFGVIGGALAHLAIGGSGVLVGFSGAVVAVMLFFCTIFPYSRCLRIPLSAKNLGWGILLSSALLALTHPAAGLPGFSMLGDFLAKRGLSPYFQLGHACHLGGALAGWWWGRQWARNVHKW